MQLNNINTHEIIVIDSIDTRSNRVFWSRYNYWQGDVTEKGSLTPDENLQDKLSESIILKDYCYGLLAANFTDFEISEDVQNWKIADRVIRLVLPRKLVLNSLIAKDELSIIIQRVIDDNYNSAEKFVYETNEPYVAYFLQIADEDGGIVQPYIDDETIKLQIKQ